MARDFYEGVVGAPGAGAAFIVYNNIEVWVYPRGLATLANFRSQGASISPIYQRDTGVASGPSPEAGATGTNPFTTGTSGSMQFWAERGKYDIFVHDLILPARVADRLIPWEASPSDDIKNASIAAAAAISESKLNLATDAASGTGSRRTLGTGATQAAPGNDSRLSNQRPPQGPETNLKIIRGTINANGTVDIGTGFTIDKTSTGFYTILLTSSFSSAPSVTLAGRQGDWVAILNGSPAVNEIYVATRSADTGVAADSAFCFIAIGPS